MGTFHSRMQLRVAHLLVHRSLHTGLVRVDSTYLSLVSAMNPHRQLSVPALVRNLRFSCADVSGFARRRNHQKALRRK